MNPNKRKWLLYWSIWAILGLYMATMDLVMYPAASSRFVVYLLPMNLLQNFAWGLGGLGVMAIARRWPLSGFNWDERKNWCMEILGCIAIALLTLILLWLISIPFAEQQIIDGISSMPLNAFLRYFSMYFHISLLLMWTVLVVYHGLHIYGKYRQRELEAVQLEGRLAQAQNAALQMQLRPHFLFNTLNSISALIHSDAEDADRMVSRLADLLRMTLDSGNSQEIPLSREMAIIDAYLNIEMIRFQDRLQVSKDIPASCLTAMVPAFLLQPLVENAIKHGVAHNPYLSTIDIRVRHEDAWLILEVLDNGKGVSALSRSGIGTQNTGARLQLLYKERHAFTLDNIPGRGTLALVRIPWSIAGSSK
jgi:two-component system, LytTR family, sensor kinase